VRISDPYRSFAISILHQNMIGVMKSRKIRWAGMQHEWKRRKYDVKH
jgi:hypothetical protein